MLAYQTTIRVLGGLLSAYHLSGRDPVFLERAKDLADRLLPVFDTPSGLPYPGVNLAKKRGIPDPDEPLLVSTAEVATLQLEFRYLSFLTDDEIYWQKVERVRASTRRSLFTCSWRADHGEHKIRKTTTRACFNLQDVRLRTLASITPFHFVLALRMGRLSHLLYVWDLEGIRTMNTYCGWSNTLDASRSPHDLAENSTCKQLVK